MYRVQNFSLSETDRSIDRAAGMKTPCQFLDFVVDGQPLYPAMRSHDLVTPLCIGWPLDAAETFVDRLLGAVPGNAHEGRVAVYVCAECGELGCGAVTVEVRRSGETVEWLSWGYENRYDGTVHPAEIAGQDDLTFDLVPYRDVLVQGLDTLREGRTIGAVQPRSITGADPAIRGMHIRQESCDGLGGPHIRCLREEAVPVRKLELRSIRLAFLGYQPRALLRASATGLSLTRVNAGGKPIKRSSSIFPTSWTWHWNQVVGAQTVFLSFARAGASLQLDWACAWIFTASPSIHFWPPTNSMIVVKVLQDQGVADRTPRKTELEPDRSKIATPSATEVPVGDVFSEQSLVIGTRRIPHGVLERAYRWCSQRHPRQCGESNERHPHVLPRSFLRHPVRWQRHPHHHPGLFQRHLGCSQRHPHGWWAAFSNGLEESPRLGSWPGPPFGPRANPCSCAAHNWADTIARSLLPVRAPATGGVALASPAILASIGE